MMTKICPRCGEPYAWLERRRHGDHVYLYAVHERTENGARRSRRRSPVGRRRRPRARWGRPGPLRVPQRGTRSFRALRRAVVH